jgi:hypothetical protein
MENEKLQPKEISVKRIFFHEKGNIPCFELDNGEVKLPYAMNIPQGVQILWFTEKEFNNLKSEIDKKKNALKIVK